MKMVRCAVLLFAFAGLSSAGCAGKATDQEVEKMCRHLTTLRGDKVDGADADPAEALNKCKTDKMITDVSSETAACRLAANDVDTFWNKCR